MARKYDVTVEEEPPVRHGHKHPRAEAEQVAAPPIQPLPDEPEPGPDPENPEVQPPMQPGAGQQPVLQLPTPPPLGKVPTSITQMQNFGGPGYAAKATHFTGPVVCGPPPGSQAVGGMAKLTLLFQVDYTMGNFLNIPVAFPPGSFLASIWAWCYQAYVPGSTPPSLFFGTTPGASDIATLVLPDALAAIAQEPPLLTLPPWSVSSPMVPFQLFMSAGANTANTAGGVIVGLDYVVLPAPWN